MVRNLIIFGGHSHPHLNKFICDHLGIPQGKVSLSKFSVGETSVEIGESIRGKDVYIIQSGSGKINDRLMEVLIMISACKTASAKRVVVVLPLFPYSRQSDVPYEKEGSTISQGRTPRELGNVGNRNGNGVEKGVIVIGDPDSSHNGHYKDLLTSSNQPDLKYSDYSNKDSKDQKQSPEASGANHARANDANDQNLEHAASCTIIENGMTTIQQNTPLNVNAFIPQPGYRQWVAQVGTLAAGLLTCAGADHVMTMDLHDPQYQGFFDIPVDNLYSRPLFQTYIQTTIPNFKDCVVVSPDAGGAKRATAIADALKMPFALIHKESRPARITDTTKPVMMLVGNITNCVAILVDDLADSGRTITNAARLLKTEGAAEIYALITHGIFSGDAIDRINASPLNKIIVTNTVPQDEHLKRCDKLEVLEAGHIFAEAIRRVHYGESISGLFQEQGV